MSNSKLTISEMHRMSVEEFRAADKLPFDVVLDNVRSRHNIGAVFRTADAFRLSRVHLCGISGTPPDAEIHKTALGAEESMVWQHHDDTADCVRQLQAEGYAVFAVEQTHGSTMLGDFRVPQGKKIAVVFGHEVYGVKQQVVDQCDGCIEIPQYGTKHSLNVSVTAGIVIYQIAMQLVEKLG